MNNMFEQIFKRYQALELLSIKEKIALLKFAKEIEPCILENDEIGFLVRL